MSFFDNVLYPIKWVVAWIMVGAHDFLTWLGLDSASGITWALSIVALVIAIRIVLIPLFVKQIKASRGMQLLQPDMQKIQKKYKGKTDPASRQAMQQEMMALYRQHGTTPFASCLPILAQMPIFFALFRVLWSMPQVAAGEYPRGGSTIGGLTQELAIEFESANFFGATLSSAFLHTEGVEPKIVSAVLIVMMSVTMLFTQRQLTMKNMPASSQNNPMARQQKMLMYLLPIIFAVTGVNFPIGVLIYWTTTNVWSLGQQWYVIRNNPTPGSEAYQRREERLARKAERKGRPLEDDTVEELEPERPRGQRQQPVSKARAKKKGVQPGALPQGEATGEQAGGSGDTGSEQSAGAKNGAGKDGATKSDKDDGENGERATSGSGGYQPGSAHHATASAASGRQPQGGKPGSNKKRRKRKQKKARR